jgi:hypothetical protein
MRCLMRCITEIHYRRNRFRGSLTSLKWLIVR